MGSKDSRCRVVLALASSRKALGIAYSIRKLLGCRIIGLFNKTTHPYFMSRVFNDKLIVNSVRGSREWVLEVAYLSHKLDADLIIPVDFIDVISLSKYKLVFDKLGVKVATPDYDKVLLASNKLAIRDVLKGICKIPRTINAGMPVNVLRELKPPLVIKGVSDASKPRYINYVDELLSNVRGTNEVVQEFFPGVGRGYFTVAVNGEPLIEFTHQRVVEYDPIGGASLMAFGPIPDPRLYRIGREVTKRLNWIGPLMVETRWNQESGDYVVLEINPKFWGSIDLPVKLNYQLPAVLAAAFIHGTDYAKKISKRLLVKAGTHSWVLDGIRYIAKDLNTWVKLLKQSLSNVVLSDLTPVDPARTVLQLLKGLSKLPKERSGWVNMLMSDIGRVRKYVKNAINELSNLRLRDIALILDLDGTVIKLDINWGKVRWEGIRRGYLLKSETISAGLYRLWLSNYELYTEFSRLLEKYEWESVINHRYKVLIKHDVISSILSFSSRGLNLCIATKQSVKVAEKVVHDLLHNNVSVIVGRDSGYGPLKIDMFKSCIKLVGAKKAIVIDDSFTAVVDAVREGLLAIRVTRNTYETLRTTRLGIPALKNNDALKFVIKLLSLISI